MADMDSDVQDYLASQANDPQYSGSYADCSTVIVDIENNFGLKTGQEIYQVYYDENNEVVAIQRDFGDGKYLNLPDNAVAGNGKYVASIQPGASSGITAPTNNAPSFTPKRYGELEYSSSVERTGVNGYLGNSGARYSEKYTVTDKGGVTYEIYYDSNGNVINVTNGREGHSFFKRGQKVDKDSTLYNSIVSIANAEREKLSTSFAASVRAGDITLEPTYNISVGETSLSMNTENVENAIFAVNKISNEIDLDIDNALETYYNVAENFMGKVGGAMTAKPNIIAVIDELNSLRSDIDKLMQMIVEYSEGKGDGFDTDWVDETFGTKINTEEVTPPGDYGPYAGPGDYGDPSVSDEDHASDIDTNIDTDIDTDTDIAKPDTDTDLASKIPSSIAGAGIGGTLLGMATGAAGVAGAGALIDGDSVLDELDDTVVVPSIIRNSPATSIKNSKKDKVGAAVGVGLAAAAAGAGLYYYSKKAEEEEDKENAEKVVLQDDNEDGAVEFQYTSGLGNVVELKDAILNDTFN